MKTAHVLTCYKLIVAVVSLGLLLPSSAFATGPRVTTSLFSPSQNEIHTLDFPPFISNDVIDGGAASEIISTAFKTAGIDTSISIHPVKRIVNYYLEQENALAIVGRHFHLSTSKQEKLIYIPVLATTEHFTYYKPNHPNGLNWTKLTELKGLTYGAHQGEDVSKYKAAGIKVVYGRTIALLKKLKSGDVDFITAPDETIKWFTHHHMKEDVNNFIAVKEHAYTEGLYIIFNRLHPEGEAMAKQFKQTLGKMRKDGTYQNIISKHLGNSDSGLLYLRRLDSF